MIHGKKLLEFSSRTELKDFDRGIKSQILDEGFILFLSHYWNHWIKTRDLAPSLLERLFWCRRFWTHLWYHMTMHIYLMYSMVSISFSAYGMKSQFSDYSLNPPLQRRLSMNVLAVSTTTRYASFVDLAFLKPYWRSDRLWVPLLTSSIRLAIIRSKIFYAVFSRKLER